MRGMRRGLAAAASMKGASPDWNTRFLPILSPMARRQQQARERDCVAIHHSRKP